MKNLAITGLILAGLSACSSSSDTANAPLEGVWHSAELGFLVISDDSIQQLSNVSYLNCRSIDFDTSYTVSGNDLVLADRAAKFNRYSIQAQQLTVTGVDDFHAEYEVYNAELPPLCDATELEGRWQKNGSTNIILDFDAGKSNFYYDYLSLNCLPAARMKYYAQQDKVVRVERQAQLRGDYRIENNNLIIEWNQAVSNSGEVKVISTSEVYASAVNNTKPVCGNEALSNTVEVDLGFKAFPNRLEDYLQQSLEKRLYWTIEIIFDVDLSGDISTGDMQFTMGRESSPYRYQSSWAALGGTLGYIRKIGATSSRTRSDIADLVVSVEGNHMKLVAEAADFEQLNQITAQTPILFKSYINFGDDSQSDYFPGSSDVFSNTGDNSALMDVSGDAHISAGWEVVPILDVVSIAVSFKE